MPGTIRNNQVFSS